MEVTPDPITRRRTDEFAYNHAKPLQASFVRNSKGQYALQHSQKLHNSLLLGVAFLELANAGDFAANVWNAAPVPKFAVALMSVGGTAAIFMTYFAVWDAVLSMRNIRLLREERRYLEVARSLAQGDLQLVAAKAKSTEIL